jgi:hypothetical protein
VVNSVVTFGFSCIMTWRVNIVLLRLLGCGLQVIWVIPEELRRE